MSSILKVDTIQDQSGNNIINENADTITIPAGATLSNLGTASGFGLTWQSVQTTGFTAVKGNAYPCDTTSAEFTVTLPATPSAGDQVQVVDYAGTFDTNKLIIDGNGEDIEGTALNFQLTGEREGVILTYIDSTQGWIATSGINEGTDALSPETYSVDFLVVAGGGAGGRSAVGSFPGSGGGAGGYRSSNSTYGSSGGGNTSAEASLSFNTGTVYTVTVGAGGAGTGRNSGSNSSLSGTGISTITSIGGGHGGGNDAVGTYDPASGGSGGGIGPNNNPGAGTVNQGYAGGNGTTAGAGDGGGGADAVGGNSSGTVAGNGGNGEASTITGSSITRGGGGGGAGDVSAIGTGGTGGGGDGGGGVSDNIQASNGTVNTGGGGGGALRGSGSPVGQKDGGNGGKGVVILRMPTAFYSSTTTGSPTVGTDGTDTILTFNDSGSYTG